MSADRPRVFGVLVVRDEVDVLRVCVLHHLAAGCERILALDNGSSDGTRAVLARLAARVPLSWTSDLGTYRQDELASGLAQEAATMGADWVLPLDADEFWTAPAGLPVVLAEDQHAGGRSAERLEFIQRRGQRRAVPRGLLTMTMRVARPTDALDAVDAFLARRRSVFELKPSDKVAFRAVPGLAIARGGHGALGMTGPVVPARMTILHAPLRSRACLERKAEHGERLEQAGFVGLQGYQVRHWAAVARAGDLAREWAAHSYGEDGTLAVGSRRVPLVRDDRLVHVLRRWVRPAAVQLAARALRRTY